MYTLVCMWCICVALCNFDCVALCNQPHNQCTHLYHHKSPLGYNFTATPLPLSLNSGLPQINSSSQQLCFFTNDTQMESLSMYPFDISFFSEYIIFLKFIKFVVGINSLFIFTDDSMVWTFHSYLTIHLLKYIWGIFQS